MTQTKKIQNRLRYDDAILQSNVTQCQACWGACAMQCNASRNSVLLITLRAFRLLLGTKITALPQLYRLFKYQHKQQRKIDLYNMFLITEVRRRRRNAHSFAHSSSIRRIFTYVLARTGSTEHTAIALCEWVDLEVGRCT